MHRVCCLYGAFLLTLLVAGIVVGQSETPPEEENFYAKSLHYTNRGIEFIYSKEHGGLERLTGMSATEMGCLKAKCHVRSCDTCHKQEVGGEASYSADAARIEEACQRCHPVEKDNPDVHFRGGMKCMDCHSAREIHGDGVLHNTYMEPGFFETRCENCHADIPQTVSHTAHGKKLDCSVCHVAQLTTCFNCHVDTRIAEGKDVQIERSGMFFLVNHGEEVRLGNLVSYVYGNRTMITMAPTFPHTIVKEGRTCDACHGTEIVRRTKDGTLEIFAWRDGEPASPEGVIPVIKGMKWNLVYLGREGDRWVPLAEPEEPLVNFSGYCAPLTRDQVTKLERRQRQQSE